MSRTIQFYDTSSGTPTLWLWDFGDGLTSAAQDPLHTYAADGWYTVFLYAENATGDSDTIEKTILVNTVFPGVGVRAAYTYSISGLNVTFLDQSYGLGDDIIAWLWDFGDGYTSDEQSPTHSYPGVGNYTVSLTVTGSGLETDVVSQAVNFTSDFCYTLPNPCEANYSFIIDHIIGTGGHPGQWVQSMDIQVDDSNRPSYLEIEMTTVFTGLGIGGAGSNIQISDGLTPETLIMAQEASGLTQTLTWRGYQTGTQTNHIWLTAAAGSTEGNAMGFVVTITSVTIRGFGVWPAQTNFVGYEC